MSEMTRALQAQIETLWLRLDLERSNADRTSRNIEFRVLLKQDMAKEYLERKAAITLRFSDLKAALARSSYENRTAMAREEMRRHRAAVLEGLEHSLRQTEALYEAEVRTTRQVSKLSAGSRKAR
jgi:hypothetical protein